MPSLTIPFDTKVKAVGEALLQKRTLAEISEEYGLSCSYLSTLTSRAKRAIGYGGYSAHKEEEKNLPETNGDLDLLAFMQMLKTAISQAETKLKTQ